MSVLVPSGRYFGIQLDVFVNQAKCESLGAVLHPESVLIWCLSAKSNDALKKTTSKGSIRAEKTELLDSGWCKRKVLLYESSSENAGKCVVDLKVLLRCSTPCIPGIPGDWKGPLEITQSCQGAGDRGMHPGGSGMSLERETPHPSWTEFQCLATLHGEKLFLMLRWNFLWFSSYFGKPQWSLPKTLFGKSTFNGSRALPVAQTSGLGFVLEELCL